MWGFGFGRRSYGKKSKGISKAKENKQEDGLRRKQLVAALEGRGSTYFYSSLDKMDDMPVDKLKEICENLGFKKTGNREDLDLRLRTSAFFVPAEAKSKEGQMMKFSRVSFELVH